MRICLVDVIIAYERKITRIAGLAHYEALSIVGVVSSCILMMKRNV